MKFVIFQSFRQHELQQLTEVFVKSPNQAVYDDESNFLQDGIMIIYAFMIQRKMYIDQGFSLASFTIFSWTQFQFYDYWGWCMSANAGQSNISLWKY